MQIKIERMIAKVSIALIVIGLWPVWQVVFDPTTDWAKGNPTLLVFWSAPQPGHWPAAKSREVTKEAI